MYPIVGVSMLPLLRQDRDVVVIERSPGRFAPGDVVLYRSGGRYVLHRIIQTRPEDYVVLGDNCVAREYGITDRDILGLMTGFVRNGRTHEIRETAYRLYTAWILHSTGLRVVWKRASARVRSLAGRLLIRSWLRIR